MAFSAEPELVWMAHDRPSSTPLDLLMHLVAGAVALDIPLPHHVVLVTMSNADGLRIEEWDGKKFVASTKPPPAVPITATRLRNLIPKVTVGMTTIWRGRVFVTHRDDPLHLPPSTHLHYGFDPNTKFDRAVLVTDTLPTTVKAELRALLDPKLFVSGTIGFGGIVPSVVVKPADAGSFWLRWFGFAGIDFVGTDEPEDDELQLPGPLGEKLRLFRDSCFIVLDLPALEQLRIGWDAGGRVPAFIDEVRSKLPQPANDAHVDIAHRWGRAATNRRVGVAVSGGGACAYRLVGLLKRLEENGVPVDVVAGLSGGAFIGAYYCTLGRAGLERAICHGPIFGALLPLATLSTWLLQKAIDFDLGCARIEEAPVRYVAVTAALPSGVPPKSRLVTSGTVGEAVRVSGTLPPAFGPSKKGKQSKARYTDGGAASLVPAQIVRNCGGDLTVSYNVLAGPSDGNPLNFLPFGIGNVLRDLPGFGRLLDVWVWFTFLWARASRQFGMHADVPIAFDQDAQMIEAVLWLCADRIAKRGYNDPEVIAQVAVVKTKWTNLQV